MAGVLALPPVHHQLCPELLVVMDISSIGSVSSRSDRLLDKLQHLLEFCSKLMDNTVTVLAVLFLLPFLKNCKFL
jgi:hypothetical protein